MEGAQLFLLFPLRHLLARALMVIAAVGIFTAVFFQRVRTGMGITFAFVFAEFFLYAFGGFSKSLEWMKTVSMRVRSKQEISFYLQYWQLCSSSPPCGSLKRRTYQRERECISGKRKNGSSCLPMRRLRTLCLILCNPLLVSSSH